MGSVSLSLSFASFYAGHGHSLLPGAGDFAWVHRLLDLADIWNLGCIFGFRTIYTSTMWLDSWTKNEMDLGFLVYKYAVRFGLSSKSFCDLITGADLRKGTARGSSFPCNDAVIRVFKRVAGLSESAGEAELSGAAGVAFCSIRLLVASTQAINLIGKQGSLIKSIEESTAASVRVLSGGPWITSCEIFGCQI